MANSIVIVPAFNEGPRISTVLETLSSAIQQKIISRVIVVNDGSQDNTAEQVKKFKNVELINFDKNKGKDSALLEGFKRAIAENADFVLTIDADLKELTTQRLNELITSIKNHDMSIGIRENAYRGKEWREWIAVHTGGERIFRASSLKQVIESPHFKKFMKKRRGFGIDLALSIIYRQTGRSITTVRLPNVVHTQKRIKIGKVKGTLQNIGMNIQWIKSGIAAKRTSTKMRRR